MVDFRERSDLSILLKDLVPLESHVRPPQDIDLCRHPLLGRVLIINGEVQHVEAWQALYHESLVHVPASFVRKISTALILGGGSLYAAREVLRYPTLRRCTLVDHDPRVIDIMVRHYPHAQVVRADPRFEFVAGPVSPYLASCNQTFDLIINDWTNLVDVTSPDGGGPIRSMTRLLTTDGVCADIMYRHMFEREHVRRTRAALEPLSPVAYSLVTVPEYPGVLHLLAVWGGRHVDQLAKAPRNITQIGWVDGQTRLGLEFYDPRFLSFHLYLPPYVKDRLDVS